jgi:hypothetical protein
MIDPPRINAGDIRRYHGWLSALAGVSKAYLALQAAKGTFERDQARRKFQDAARAPDRLVPPAPWGDWEALGAAIHWRRRNW